MQTISLYDALPRPSSWTRVARVAVIELLFAAGIAIYWTLFFSGAFSLPTDSTLRLVYLGYERAFPAADGCLAIALCVAATGIVKRRFYGTTVTAACGGAAVFLGVLDLSFNLQHGIYSLEPADGILCALINGSCLAAGFFLIYSRLPVHVANRAARKPQ
jgi:hypothetical protein